MAFTAVKNGPGVCPAQAIAFATTVLLAELLHPFAFFAVIVYLPAARLLKTPDAWKVPLFKLNVKPVPPVAVAVILPLEEPASVGAGESATTTVTPVQGSAGAAVLLPLLHALKIMAENNSIRTVQNSWFFFIKIY